MKKESTVSLMLDDCPDVLTKEQMYKVCHISKKNAEWLLMSGLVPCMNNGKKTRCYSIKKTAIVAYLEEREKYPAKYAAPENWYKGRGNTRAINRRYFVPVDFNAEKAKAYYSKLLADHRDVLTVSEVIDFCGYGKGTVLRWIQNNQLKAIPLPSKYVVPKTYLIVFLLSDYYNKVIIKKSKKHIDSLWKISALEE